MEFKIHHSTLPYTVLHFPAKATSGELIELTAVGPKSFDRFSQLGAALMSFHQKGRVHLILDFAALPYSHSVTDV